MGSEPDTPLAGASLPHFTTMQLPALTTPAPDLPTQPQPTHVAARVAHLEAHPNQSPALTSASQLQIRHLQQLIYERDLQLQAL